MDRIACDLKTRISLILGLAMLILLGLLMAWLFCGIFMESIAENNAF